MFGANKNLKAAKQPTAPTRSLRLSRPGLRPMTVLVTGFQVQLLLLPEATLEEPLFLSLPKTIRHSHALRHET